MAESWEEKGWGGGRSGGMEGSWPLAGWLAPSSPGKCQVKGATSHMAINKLKVRPWGLDVESIFT